MFGYLASYLHTYRQTQTQLLWLKFPTLYRTTKGPMEESAPYNLKMERPVPSKTVISYVSMKLPGATSYEIITVPCRGL
jgi:hypothetical protein